MRKPPQKYYLYSPFFVTKQMWRVRFIMAVHQTLPKKETVTSGNSLRNYKMERKKT